MLVPCRFIALDDKQIHLSAIKQAFQSEHADCVCVLFDPAADVAIEPFRGVRALFIDLHLTEGPIGSDNRHHFGVIGSLLERVISPAGGPFILVLWTEHPQHGDELRDYLDANIDTTKPYARPINVLSIDKTVYIDIATGAARLGAPSLQAEIRAAVSSNVQLSALLAWETEVVTAAGNTLASLFDLIPPENRTSARYSSELDTLLSRLASAAIGKTNAAANPRSAINATLAPILADRVLNQNPLAGSEALWRDAVTRVAADDLGKPSKVQAAQINGMLHIAKPSSESIASTDWGAVVTFPYPWTDEETKRLFGVSIDTIKTEEFKIKADSWPSCTVCLVRIGASCDYAQSRRGPLTYLLAIEMPSDAVSNSNRKIASPSEWRTPLIQNNQSSIQVELVVNCRYIIAIPAAQCADWQVRYRLREALLTALINCDANYMARPGIIELIG